LPNIMAFELLNAAAIPEQLLTQSRSDATAVGYANGWSQGLREVHVLHAGEAAQSERRIAAATARHTEALQAATFAIHEAADELERTTVPAFDELSSVILAAAVEIAEALLGCELRDPKIAGDAALSRVLNLVPANDTVTVRLNPEDCEVLSGTGAFTNTGADERRIILVPDTSLESGESVATSGAMTIDARLSKAIVRLKEHLAQ
jgi:flagellar assembly protein FliH